MLKRLVVGLLKGVVVGALLGAAVHFGLGWTDASGLLGYLLAMGAGATSGVLAGTPPWRQATWIESLLKAGAGLGVGALLYWLGVRWGDFPLPFALPGLAAGSSWTRAPILFMAAVSAVFGALVELDNTGDEPPVERGSAKKVRARVERAEDAELLAERSRRAERKR